jgi:hypothetical protein
MRRGALIELMRETLEPFVERFALSRQRREGLQQAILGYHRLLEGGWTAARRVRFSRWPYFDDALALLEIRAAATGAGKEEIELWRRASVVREKPGPAVKKKRRRRRRRRRRRKKAD